MYHHNSASHSSPDLYKITQMATYNLMSGTEFFRVAVIWAACPEKEGKREGLRE